MGYLEHWRMSIVASHFSLVAPQQILECVKITQERVIERRKTL